MSGLVVIQKCVENVMSYDGPLFPPHPNVVLFELQGSCKCNQQIQHPYSTICMLQEENLKSHLDKNSDELTVKIVLLQLAHAVNHIHENGWVHGNITLENTYLSKGRVLLSHTTQIPQNRNSSRTNRAKDIADLQTVFRAILKLNKAKEIQGTDSVIVVDLLEAMKKAPRDALRKTIAKDLLKALKDASINSTTSESVTQQLRITMESIPDPSFREEMKKDLINIIRNPSEVPRIGVLKNLFKTMKFAWKVFIENLEAQFDCVSTEIVQDVLDVVKNVTEDCKKSIAMDLRSIVNNAPNRCFKDSIVKGVLQMTGGVMNDYMQSAADELREIINAPEGTKRILKHPYFWDSERKLNFLAKVTQFSKGGDIGKPTKVALDAKSGEVFGGAGWLAKLSITDKAEQDECDDHYRKRKKNTRLSVYLDAIKDLALTKSERESKVSEAKKKRGVKNQRTDSNLQSGLTSRLNNDIHNTMDLTSVESEKKFMGSENNTEGVTNLRDENHLQPVSTSQPGDDNPTRGTGNVSGNSTNKEKQYDYDKLQSLLNFIRNKREHLWQDSLEAQACFGYNFTDGYWKFFNRRFPKLFLVVYEVIKEHKRDSGIEIAYFQTTTENKNLPVSSAEDDTEAISEMGLQSSIPETMKHPHQDVVEIE